MNNSTIEKKFGDKVREFRVAQKLSQEELSFRSTLHRNYLSDVERGTRNPSLRAIEKIAMGLGINISDLFIE